MGIYAICYNVSHFDPWVAYDPLPRLPSLIPNAKNKKVCKKESFCWGMVKIMHIILLETTKVTLVATIFIANSANKVMVI